ncbi:hypothetical protein HMPREF1339_01409 [Enterococcus faecalis ERV72]|nr:hypothetical protein HMPREF1339_01409 [Enterococcus faecalis ERV72]
MSQKRRAWDKNHFGFLLHAQKLINGGNRSKSFGNKPKIIRKLKNNFRKFLLISRS